MHPSTSRVCGSTANTVCTKNPRPRSLPICPTPLILCRCDRSMSVVSGTNSATGEALACSLLCCRCGCINASLGDIWLIQQPIQRFGLFPGVHLSGQRTQGVLRQVGGRLYRASRATHIVQLDAPKGSLGPAFGIQHFLCSHPSIL